MNDGSYDITFAKWVYVFLNNLGSHNLFPDNQVSVLRCVEFLNIQCTHSFVLYHIRGLFGGDFN